MDARDHSIVTQVAFKAAVEFESELDMTSPEGQARFEQVFSFLHQSLVQAVGGDDATEQAAQLIHANFPGTVQVGGYANGGGYQQAPQQQSFQPQYAPQGQGGGITIKGAQHGPIPDWLIQEAAAKGVTEVYDNRDRATGTKRPWFKDVRNADNAFWPPR
jgi:hypothetical protein